MAVNNTRTRLITNDGSEDIVIRFPHDDPTVVDGLQVNAIEGNVFFKGEGVLLGENSEYIPIPEGSSMNFNNVGNSAPNGAKTIKIEPGATISLIAYD
jgi:hypothetical protein